MTKGGPQGPPLYVCPMSSTRFKVIPAVHLFLMRGDEVLLLLRQNTGFQDGNYSVVAGHLDGDEQVVDAIIREAREEAGISLEPHHVQVVGVMHRQSDSERIDFFASASQWQGTVTNCEPHKCGGLEWHALDALPQNMVPYVRTALDQFQDGDWFTSYGWD